MRKSALKKLALHKETLRSLNEVLLPDVTGEGPDQSLQYSKCPSCGIVPCSLPCSGTCLPSDCG